MFKPKPPLPAGLVKSMFARLMVTWGRDFMSQYEGLDDSAVAADWADKLRGYMLDVEPGERPEAPAIRWALDNLPEKPLNVIGFRALCGRYTSPEAKRLLPAPPRPLPASVAAEFRKLAQPLDDKRPERVRIASRFIAIHSGKEKLTPMVQSHLSDCSAIVEAYENDQKAKEVFDALD